jgi:hypothetical protein
MAIAGAVNAVYQDLERGNSLRLVGNAHLSIPNQFGLGHTRIFCVIKH